MSVSVKLIQESHSLSFEAFSENIHWSFQSIKIFYQDYFKSFRQAESYKISLNESIVFKFIGEGDVLLSFS